MKGKATQRKIEYHPPPIPLCCNGGTEDNQRNPGIKLNGTPDVKNNLYGILNIFLQTILDQKC